MGAPVRKVVILSLGLKLIPRRDKQHKGITLGLGGLYPEPEVVRAILAPQDGVTKKIIDLGQYLPSELAQRNLTIQRVRYWDMVG
jgi:hypothetical protein